IDEVERYAAPETLDEALALLADGDATILAGGTDLMVQAQAGRVRYRRTLLNVRRVGELRGVRVDGDALVLGALTTITELLEDPLVHAHAPLLAQAADRFASAQIRNAGTVGGNVCNASPAGDTLVPLLALDAEVELAGKPNGSCVTRRLPLEQFLLGPGRTAREAHELLVALRLPLRDGARFAAFDKFGTRPALDISTVSLALAARREHGALVDVRVAFGAVAPTVLRARRTEAALEGRPLDAATIEAAAQVAHAEVSPIDDVRATAWYRRELVRNLTRRMLRHAAAT
ncbi:MAG TPA: xanthine dehydrogenase family protein subunit M, partial [Gammaproteobacteria bacterium]